MRIENPATGEVIAEVEEWNVAQIQAAFEKAQNAQRNWATQSVAERLVVVQRFGQLVLENADALAAIMTRETGKPLQQSLNEINGANNRVVHLSANAEKWLASEVMEEGGVIRSCGEPSALHLWRLLAWEGRDREALQGSQRM